MSVIRASAVKAAPRAPASPDLSSLPVVAQVLFQHIEAAKTQGEREEIHGRLSNYLKDFSQKDIPGEATAALNQALARFNLAPVTTPVSALQASFERLSNEALRKTQVYSSHTGHMHDMPAEHVQARRAFILNLKDKVESFGATMTPAELQDAARILELGLKNLRT